jgi:hypothetical protein
MTGRVRKTAGDVGHVPDMEFQRVRVGADGYDRDGAYWGAGPDVFIATLHNGAQEITVRAKSVAEARDKVAAELARASGAKQVAKRDQLGGASSNKTRYEIDWRDPVADSSTRICIEVESLSPKKAALPISETGYLSHFLPALALINAGGPVIFVTAWLDSEAMGKNWKKLQATRSQGDLFQWADANTEVGRRKSSTKAKRPVAKPAKARAKRRDPA